MDQPLFLLPIPLGENFTPLPVSQGQVYAIFVILLLAFINWFGVRWGGGVQLAVTVLKVLLISAIVAIGLFSGQGETSNFQSSVPARGGVAGFFAALVAALWAYDGWNNVSMVSSEIKQPQKNLPRALIYGTGLVVAIYLLTNIAYFFVLDSSAVAASDRVAAVMMQRFSERGRRLP